MRYAELCRHIAETRHTWLITGVAGFVGCNLLEALLMLDQTVVGLDNFATGHRRNLQEIQHRVTPARWARFRFIEGDIRKLDDCRNACDGIDYVLHQAALGSVPRSIEDPIAANSANIDGFLNMLVAARDAAVARFVYAGSSATYGDWIGLPKVEDVIGKPLSPYAVSKFANELYADVFAGAYGFNSIGLRYFNIFGPRQDPNGAYAAVIPKWIAAMIRNEPIYINGDGETSRDFCYVANAVQANLLAACTVRPDALNQVYNVAVGQRTTLNQLFDIIKSEVAAVHSHVRKTSPQYGNFRTGDVRHSLADISKARRLLNYVPSHTLVEGLKHATPWYIERLGR